MQYILVAYLFYARPLVCFLYLWLVSVLHLHLFVWFLDSTYITWGISDKKKDGMNEYFKDVWAPGQFSSVTQSCLTLCNPMNGSMGGFPVHHQLSEPAQTHVYQVCNATQPSHPLLSPSIFPSIRVFSNESVLHIRWPSIGKYSKVVQLYISIYLFFCKLFSHLGYYRILTRVSCAIE